MTQLFAKFAGEAYWVSCCMRDFNHYSSFDSCLIGVL